MVAVKIPVVSIIKQPHLQYIFNTDNNDVIDANSNTGLQHCALFFVFIIGVTCYMVSRER